MATQRMSAKRAERKFATSSRGAHLSAGVGAGLLAAFAGAQVAQAETVWLEAESLYSSFRGTITTPLQIKDSAAASGGAFVEVAAGKNSKTTPPALGQACYVFSVYQPDDYKVWGRVIAATDGNDSFWARMSHWSNDSNSWVDESWINWNEIKLGSGWHWDFIHNDSQNNVPIAFTLDAGDHRLCIGYREDGTKLDTLVVSNENFDPTRSISEPPAASDEVEVVGGRAAMLVAWRTVQGATSYNLQRRADGSTAWVTRATSLTGHSFVDSNVNAGFWCYRVIARGPTGSSVPSTEGCGERLWSTYTNVVEAESRTLTAPMTINGNGDVEVAPGHNSLNAPPTGGSARWDFRLASAMTLRFWAIIEAPNKDSDSFWVRVDDGDWIKWNNLRPQDPEASCTWDVLHDSDNGDSSVKLSLGVGSHVIEVAYREEGATLDRLLVTDDLSTSNAPGCFD
jgi:hypothetical protein